MNRVFGPIWIRLINHALTNSWSSPFTASEPSRRLRGKVAAHEYRPHKDRRRRRQRRHGRNGARPAADGRCCHGRCGRRARGRQLDRAHQLMLKVALGEVAPTIIKELGINLSPIPIRSPSMGYRSSAITRRRPRSARARRYRGRKGRRGYGANAQRRF